MSCFFFFKQICTEKKNPRIINYTVQSPCPSAGGRGSPQPRSWARQRSPAGVTSAQGDMGYGKFMSSLCSPVYLVQNITFFKHIYRVCTNRKWLQITTRLGKMTVPLPHCPRPEVWLLCIYICIKKSAFRRPRWSLQKKVKRHKFILKLYKGSIPIKSVHVLLPEERFWK